MSNWNDDYDDEPTDEELEEMAEVKTPENPGEAGITVTMDARLLDTIVQTAAQRISSALQDTVAKIIAKRIDEVLDESWKRTVGEMAQQAIETYLTKARVKTNSYGEPIHGRQTTISELIPKTVSEYMDQKVDDNGRPDSYGKHPTRLTWIIEKMVRQQLEAETSKAAQNVTAKAREVVASHVARFISEQMVPAIELSRG